MFLFTVSKRNKTHKIVRETIINQHGSFAWNRTRVDRLEESRSRKGVDKEWKSPGGGNIEE